MSAGVPNWQGLAKQGKLPENQRGQIPMLTQLDAAQARIKELEELVDILRKNGGVDPREVRKEDDADEKTQLKCEQCPAMIGGDTETEARIALEKHVVEAHPITQ